MPAMRGLPNHVTNVKIKVIGPKCIFLRVCPTTKEEISRKPFFNYSFQVEELNRCAVETKVGANHLFFN